MSRIEGYLLAREAMREWSRDELASFLIDCVSSSQDEVIEYIEMNFPDAFEELAESEAEYADIVRTDLEAEREWRAGRW
jgi:hypothetical protein